jgi:hypothetical protein
MGDNKFSKRSTIAQLQFKMGSKVKTTGAAKNGV